MAEHICTLHEGDYNKNLKLPRICGDGPQIDDSTIPTTTYTVEDGEKLILSYRYDVDIWSLEQARTHAHARGGEIIAASGYEESNYEWPALIGGSSTPIRKIEKNINNLKKESGQEFTLQAIPKSLDEWYINAVDETASVVELQMVDRETYLSAVHDGIPSVSGADVCEKCLFLGPNKTNFVYQLQLTGIKKVGEIHPKQRTYGKIRWLANYGEKVITVGFSLRPSRIGEKDMLFSAALNEPIEVSQIRPPQHKDWLDKAGPVQKGNPGASKNRHALYLLQDGGELEILEQKVGLHLLKFNGDRLSGVWILESVPCEGRKGWTLTKVDD